MGCCVPFHCRFPSVSIRFSRMMNKRMMNKRIRAEQSWVRAGIFFLLTASLSFGGIDMLNLSRAKPGASVSGMSDMTAEVGQDPSWKIIEMGDNKGVRYCASVDSGLCTRACRVHKPTLRSRPWMPIPWVTTTPVLRPGQPIIIRFVLVIMPAMELPHLRQVPSRALCAKTGA